MDDGTISNMKTFIIIALIVLLFMRMTKKDYIIIENGPFEGFKTLGGDDIGECGLFGCNVRKDMYSNTDFRPYLRGERYTVKTSEGNTICSSPFNTCDSKWDVSLDAGANGTCSDKVWHNMEPRAIMVDNCLHCGDFTGNYVAPAGYSD